MDNLAKSMNMREEKNKGIPRDRRVWYIVLGGDILGVRIAVTKVERGFRVESMGNMEKLGPPPTSLRRSTL